jgi:hypothetical protein
LSDYNEISHLRGITPLNENEHSRMARLACIGLSRRQAKDTAVPHNHKQGKGAFQPQSVRSTALGKRLIALFRAHAISLTVSPASQ